MDRPRIVPELYVSQIQRTVDFYTSVLGFAIRNARPVERFAHLERNGAELMVEQTVADARTFVAGALEFPYGRGVHLQIEVDDVEALWKQVLSADAPVFLPLESRWYRVGDHEEGNRQFVVLDPDGYLLRFWSDLGRRRQLLNTESLIRSEVVANATMNRTRQLVGPNSYAKDLGFDPLAFLVDADEPAVWLDLCCGSGRALVEAAQRLARRPDADRFKIVGVDLAGVFAPNPHPELLTLVEAPLEAFDEPGPFRLITCVHGLHYVGDRLGALARWSARLADRGRLAAHLDLDHVLAENGAPLRTRVSARLRAAGFTVEKRRLLVRRDGPATIDFGLTFVGADDTVGSNATGQPAVASHYRSV